MHAIRIFSCQESNLEQSCYRYTTRKPLPKENNMIKFFAQTNEQLRQKDSNFQPSQS